MQLILICFSIISPSSFESVEQKWIKEIKKFNQNAPILLIGTKIDLRENEKLIERLNEKNLQPINFSQGLDVCKKIAALNYFEVSALQDKKALLKVFTDSIRLVYDPAPERKKKKAKCVIA